MKDLEKTITIKTSYEVFDGENILDNIKGFDNNFHCWKVYKGNVVTNTGKRFESEEAFLNWWDDTQDILQRQI